jgi:hypothetical protein
MHDHPKFEMSSCTERYPTSKLQDLGRGRDRCSYATIDAFALGSASTSCKVDPALSIRKVITRDYLFVPSEISNDLEACEKGHIMI